MSDEQWLDEWEQGEQEDVSARTPISELGRIAYDPGSADSVRVQALRVLLERQGNTGDVDPGAVAMAAWVQSLSGEELDKALAQYFDPGFIGKAVAPKIMTPDYRAQAERARREMHEEALAQAKAAVEGGQESSGDAEEPAEAVQEPGPKPVRSANEELHGKTFQGPMPPPPGVDPDQVPPEWIGFDE